MNEESIVVTRDPDQNSISANQIARGLGWFSIGLGLAEMLAPGKLARALGLEDHENLIRGFGAREIGAGVMALSPNPAPAMWARFGGDLMDLGVLAIGMRNGDAEQRRNAGIAIAAVVGISLIDMLTAAKLSKETSSESPRSDDRSGDVTQATDAVAPANEFATMTPSETAQRELEHV